MLSYLIAIIYSTPYRTAFVSYCFIMIGIVLFDILFDVLFCYIIGPTIAGLGLFCHLMQPYAALPLFSTALIVFYLPVCISSLQTFVMTSALNITMLIL